MHGSSGPIKRLVLEMLPSFAFFSVAFCLIVIADALTMAQYGIRPFRIISGIALAILVSRAVVLMDRLPFIDRFRGRPLLYNTLWKTGIYVAAAIALQYAKLLLQATLLLRNPIAANERVISSVVWSRFFAIQIWLAITFGIYVAARELSRSLGNGRLREMFLGK